ncbi:magnesium/cobalt transporter CorA [Streptomyces cocklensis]|uniref:magnesium/cobalt transporter CorA n=1 Tax=Actinacidiphila cocklensis TaxID=887465 RepID=UPI002041BAFE|nr:magnesium/cobalt transporter CorA [Actinacidiphila cocklensis]MDD1063311.1 magnesium/cobalt transporter CorA [Actinacidiphila cocklensis]WSX81717.1 magnesium/cobalt transporter CorA [Streptomyces sp. NBC_00899]
MIRSLRSAARRVQRRPRRVDLSHPARSPLGSAVVNCVVYRDGVRQLGDCTPDEAVRKIRRSGGFVWMGLYEPTQEEFAGITELFGLHPLAVEDSVHAHQRPKVERYDGTLFTVLKTVAYVTHERLTTTSEIVSTGEIMVFTGPDFVITVRHGGHSSLGPMREELEGRPDHLALGPMAVLHAIVDHVVDQYLDVTDSVQDDVDAVEIEVFSPTGTRGTDAGRIYQLKRELLELKRAVSPLVRPLQLLVERAYEPVDPEIRRYFRDVGDHLSKANEQINAFDELLNSILQANIAQVTVAQNEDMRKITAWAAIIAVPTLISGIYGMNFDHMPELHWLYGYPIVVAVMVTACLLIHRGFRRNGWL